MDQTNEVVMELEDEENMDSEHESPIYKSDPKNVLEAGAQMSARLSQ